MAYVKNVNTYNPVKITLHLWDGKKCLDDIKQSKAFHTLYIYFLVLQLNTRSNAIQF